ncbi:hypothetical protein ABGB12_33395 [Actinocorallia sp. B10E7]|uniref:hypothetical protein n=1 Tax=Actinocorallia sp. B10E7 TaxID=3153558 RepID=UPI00325DCC0E
MVGKPPSVVFIGLVAILCICLTGLEALISVDEIIVFWAGLATVFSIPVIIVRTTFTEGAALRDWAPLLLIVATILFLTLSVPSQSRMMLSKSSLDQYAREVMSADTSPRDECAKSFPERWVGLYRISCTYYDGKTVHLLVDEPLVPSAGSPWLMGPGEWDDVWLQD